MLKLYKPITIMIPFLIFILLLQLSLSFRVRPHPSKITFGVGVRRSIVRSLPNNNIDLKTEVGRLIEDIKLKHKDGSIVVIKYGGHAMESSELKELFCEDIADLYRHTGIVPVIVHGGGPQIAGMLKALNIESEFVDGLRVTNEATMEVAQMVLCGSVNKEISAKLSRKTGVKGALGLAGMDCTIISATRKDKKLGLVGEPVAVNSDIVKSFLKMGLVPVIAPIGVDAVDGTCLNVNADTAAGAVAEALKADTLLLLTDVVGVLDKDKKLIDKIPSSSLGALTEDGTIRGGMIPKLVTAAKAVEAGVGAVSIMDGREKHCVLRALSGQKFGTIIIKG